MKAPLFALLVVWLLSAQASLADDAQDWAAIDRIEKALQRIVVPRFEYHDAPLQDALDYCAQKLREEDKSGAGIPIIIKLYGDPFEYGPPDPSFDIGKSAQITVSLKNTSLYHALEYAAGMANLRVSIRPDCICLRGPDHPGYLFTREFQIPPAFFRSVHLGNPDRAESVKYLVRDYLLWDSATALPDPWDYQRKCVFNPTATRMTVRDTKENLERIEKSFTFPRTPSVPGPEVPKVLSAEKEAEVQQAWQKIVLPSVSFAETPLEEVVATANRWYVPESIEESYGLLYDRPNSRGGPSVPGIPGYTPPPPSPEPKITYTAKNVSAWDALQAIARLADLEVLNQGGDLQLAPRKTIYTRHYLIPPDAWPQSSIKLPPVYTEGREGGEEWLKAGGVQLGEGTALRFAFKDRMLSVSNTAAEHRKIQSMVERAWQTYYAARKPGKGKTRQVDRAMNHDVPANHTALLPEGGREPMFQRDFPIPRDFFPAYEKQDRLHHTAVARQMRQDIRGFLQANGVPFEEGSAASLNVGGTRLTVRQAEVQLEDIADILEGIRPQCAFPTYDRKVPKIIAHGENAALMSKIQRIVLPEVKFAETRIIDALQILHDLSVRYDTESTRASRGVKIVLEEDGHPVAAPPRKLHLSEDPHAVIVPHNLYEREFDYTGAQITLLEAVEAVARHGNWEVDISRSEVTLRAATEGGAMITQEYLLPPDRTAAIHARLHSRAGRAGDDPVRDLLSSGQFLLPAKSSVHYEENGSRLIIQNAEEQQRQAREWVEWMWRCYYDDETRKRKTVAD